MLLVVSGYMERKILAWSLSMKIWLVEMSTKIQKEVFESHEIRTIYPRHRWDIMRHIILQKLTGDAMEAYIQDRMQAEIPSAVQVDFYEDLKDDLRLINPIRIAGLGVSTEELLAWQGIHHDE